MADNKDKKVLNVPALRFPEFSGEWDFELLDAIAPNITSGKSKPSIGEYNLYGSTGIIGKTANADYSGDMLLVARVGANAGSLQLVNDNCGITDNTLIIKPCKLSSHYLYFYLQRYNLNRLVFGSGQPLITASMLKKVRIPFGNQLEQRKIEQLLVRIDERISVQNKIIEKLETLIKGIVELAFNHAATSNTLGCYITQISKRNKIGKNLPVLSVSNKHGFVEQSEQFEDRIIASDDTSNYKIVNINDFAYNPARINVGSIARLKNKECGIVSPMYICFRTLGNTIPEYLELFFKSKQFSFEVNKRLEGSVRLCLQYEGLCEITIPVLPVEKQQIWVTKITALYAKLAIEKGLQNSYQVQKQFLLSQMFI